MVLYNYAIKADLKTATGVYTSKVAKKVDLASLKSDVDKLNIDKSKNVQNNLNNLKSKVDLSKLSDVVKHDVVKKCI